MAHLEETAVRSALRADVDTQAFNNNFNDILLASANNGKINDTNDHVQILDFAFNTKTLMFSLSINTASFVLISVIILICIFIYKNPHFNGFKDLEIDETEIGIGNGKLKLKPNVADRQVAYQVWVELNTRKIGLPIDLNNDVIDDIYSSWHQFFSVTRELIKGVPVSKVSSPSTKAIIRLSIEVLNEGLRPHLTLWQARFRSWYERQLKTDNDYEEPQDIQKRFPKYDELTQELLAVNTKLIAYRKAMYRLVHGNDK